MVSVEGTRKGKGKSGVPREEEELGRYYKTISLHTSTVAKGQRGGGCLDSRYRGRKVHSATRIVELLLEMPATLTKAYSITCSWTAKCQMMRPLVAGCRNHIGEKEKKQNECKKKRDRVTGGEGGGGEGET